jgi:hypothetical protein
MIVGLPEQEMERAVIGSFVRLTVQDACVLALVSDIEPSAPYSVIGQNRQQATLSVQLRCKRGNSNRLFKISHVSNQALLDGEFDQWRSFEERSNAGNTGPVDLRLLKLGQQVVDIAEVRATILNNEQIEGLLARKRTLEFLPQQESRMRSLLQCTLSQMDISDIQGQDANELAGRYQKVVGDIKTLEDRGTKTQEEWFENRPALYSIKETNRKNFFRQQNRDRHALDYVLRNEAAGESGLNPFQRRACRPVCAWDTKLTVIEGMTEPNQGLGGAPQAEAPKAPDAQPSGAAEAKPKEASLSRVDSVLRAHRRYTNLMAKLGSVLVA